MGAPVDVCKIVIGEDGFPYGVSISSDATA